ncbi:MAG: hypothetical protein QXR73_03930, partial [Candidatus Micrarchaeaceae archaeon]
MNQYSDFSKELVSRYMSTDEETNELYKKRYVPLGSEKLLELATAKPEKADGEPELKKFYETFFKDSGLIFDAIIGPSGAVFLRESGAAIKIVDAKDATAGAINQAPIYPNDKYNLLINAYARKTVIIQVPEGTEKSMNILFAAINEPLILKVIIEVGRDSSLNLMEWYASSEAKTLLS